MKAKKIVALLVPLLALASCDLSGVFGAGPEDSKKTENQTNELVKALYEEYLANGGKLSYEEWLQVLKGEKTEVEKGLDGITPHIGDNGNWWIGDTDTGVHAQGSQGNQGEKGDKGDAGSQGIQGEQGVQGEKGETGEQGEQGEKGEDGVSIVNAYVDSKFHLILILSNGAVIDCGFVGAPGTEVFDTFTVTFKDCDGTVLKEETVISGDSATAPSVPSRNGYVFTGWDKSFANVAENIQVTAQFEKLYSRPTIAVESVSASAGDEGLAINIDVFNSPGVCTIFSKLSFNTAALTLKNVTFNSSLGGMASTSQTGSYTSPVRLNWSNPLNDYDGDFTFATLIFDVNGGLTAGDYDLTYSYNSSDVFNLNEDDVSFDIVSGVVSII